MPMRVRTIIISIVVLAIAAIAGLFSYPLPDSFPGASLLNGLTFKLGLDLQGGAHLTYQADVSQIPAPDRDAAVEGVRDVIERRVNALGISEPVVQTNKTAGGDYRVIVELAGVFDVDEAKAQIGETPLLEFKELADENAGDTTENQEDEEGNKDNEELRAQAQSVLERALAGEDFAELARTLSQDPGSKDAGGDLGFIASGVFVPEFDEVLFDKSFVDGSVWPELVETQFGYHIIQKLHERNEGEEKEVQARHILLRRESSLPDPLQQSWVNTALSGKHLMRSEVLFDPNTGAPQVGLQFDQEGDDLFREITARNVGQPVAIFLDGEPISIPVVQQEIIGGRAVVSGQFTIPEARLLSQRLNAGALPVPIELVSQQTIGPSLGLVAVERSMRAGVVGLILVAVFMILYYRLPGLLGVVALAVYASFILALFKLFGVTLTLAGVAGFILSLGLAVDANVLIFERMKEELRRGSELSEAIEVGFSRAWTSIRDSNISSLLTAVILYWFGSSLIRGFAITLSIGIVISMITAVIVTRSFLRLFSGASSRWLFGVGKSSSEHHAPD